MKNYISDIGWLCITSCVLFATLIVSLSIKHYLDVKLEIAKVESSCVEGSK